MRFALINPNWNYEGSVFFGCQQPHLPLELGYAKALLERAGHEAVIIDGHLEDLSLVEIMALTIDAEPDVAVVTTAPSYLFWSCAPPEMRVPLEVTRHLRPVVRTLVAVGPHATITPRATLAKLEVDLAILGEPEQVLTHLANAPEGDWSGVPSIAYRVGDEIVQHGQPWVTEMNELPALHWGRFVISRHEHHHLRHERVGLGPAAEMEASRGCPNQCTFCARDLFRAQYRRRPLSAVIEELDGLIENGAEYIYFIDEVFMPWPDLIEELAVRPVRFGIQTQIDLWEPASLKRLGEAGCVSLSAGIEAVSEQGRLVLGKSLQLAGPQLAQRLAEARRHVPYVQATLLGAGLDTPETVAAWQREMRELGIKAAEPAPLFPYPGSLEYSLRWGEPDDMAWERAHAHFLELHTELARFCEGKPYPLPQLELDANYAM